MDDTDAYDFYAEPANREPGPGPARRVRRQRPVKYDTHVPVRFTSDVIDQVKTFADEDGVTVSTWIRQAVRRELRRRTAEPDRLTRISMQRIDRNLSRSRSGDAGCPTRARWSRREGRLGGGRASRHVVRFGL